MKKILISVLMYLVVITCANASDLRFAQVTDVKYFKSNPALSKVINDINKQQGIDFVVFTGDNINSPVRENLEGFIKETKKLKVPCYVIIGDRDVNKYKGLSKKQYAHYLKKNLKTYRHEDTNYTFEYKGIVFMVVDGARDVIPGTNGYYKDDVLEWTDANLVLNKHKNVVILQHFPLIPPNNNENYETFKPEKYLNIIKNHKNVKAVISGHFGINKEITDNGIVHISTAPLPTYRIIDIIDTHSDKPTIWAEIRNIDY